MNKQNNIELYTSQETRKKLGVSSSTLANLVTQGTIEKVTPPGRKHGFYTRASVDAYHQQQSAFQKTYKLKSTIVFREATIEDIEQEAELAAHVFGDRAEALEERKSFIRANPHCDYHLYDDGKLVAYIDLIPMEHDAIMDWVYGKVIVWEIDPANIQPFEPGKPVECLIADMITSPAIPIVKRTYYGRRLLVGLIRKFEEMGRQGIIITKIYAGSSPSTPIGLRIIRQAEFQEIYRRGEKVLLELDVMNSDGRLVRGYKQVLREYQQQHV
jgi:hypothetical protein